MQMESAERTAGSGSGVGSKRKGDDVDRARIGSGPLRGMDEDRDESVAGRRVGCEGTARVEGWGGRGSRLRGAWSHDGSACAALGQTL